MKLQKAWAIIAPDGTMLAVRFTRTKAIRWWMCEQLGQLPHFGNAKERKARCEYGRQ